MRLPIPFLILASGLLAWVAALPDAAATAATVSFHISDETDPAEVTEATTVFINGQLVAHFELSANPPVRRRGG